MPDLWQQFHSLPKTIRDGISTPAVIATLDELEETNPSVDVGNVLMRVVIRELNIKDLESVLQKDDQIDATLAKKIADRLRREVFVGVIADYLGLTPEPQAVVKPVAPMNLSVQPAVSQPMSAVPPVMATPPPLQPITGIPKPPTISTLQPLTPVGTLAPTTQYSDADAAEIEQQVSKLHALNTTNQDFDSLARSILTGQNLAFSDELLDRRAVSIVKARLKGVRSNAETVIVLTRDPKIGGLGLDPEIAKTLSVAVDRAAGEVKERGMVKPLEVPLPPVPPPVPSIIQARPTPMPPMRQEAPVTVPVMTPNFTEAARTSRPIIRPKDLPMPPALSTPPPLAPAPKNVMVTSTPVMPRARLADRPTVADIVRPSKTLGPAEEMRSLTLIEFRRMGQGAADAANKMLNKFQHLKKESYAVWSQAIAGWRESDVYQLYLTMGRESLEKGVPISQIIADRGRTGLPYLSDHEFSVLVDLNRQLQF